VKAINEGIGIEETSVVFSFSPAAYMHRADGALTILNRFTKDGNVHATKAHCVDTAMWEIGGVAVALRLIQLAQVMLRFIISCKKFNHYEQTPHELSRTLGILADGLRNSWQNSEDMERMRTSLPLPNYSVLMELYRRIRDSIRDSTK
jgi:hypothetical protein